MSVPLVALQPIQPSCVPLEIFSLGDSIVTWVRNAGCEAPDVLVARPVPCLDDCVLGRSFQLVIADVDSDLVFVDARLQEGFRPSCIPLVTHAETDLFGFTAQMGTLSMAYQYGQVAAALDDLDAMFMQTVHRTPAQVKLVRQTDRGQLIQDIYRGCPYGSPDLPQWEKRLTSRQPIQSLRFLLVILPSLGEGPSVLPLLPSGEQP